MNYEYFIASRYRNKETVLELTQKLRAKGKAVYCFVESPASVKSVGKIEDNAEAAISDFEAIPQWQQDPRVREVFETDMAALRNSANLILLLPAGKSAHMEAGVAYGLGKHLVVIGEQKATESLYLVFDEFYDDIDDFIASLG